MERNMLWIDFADYALLHIFSLDSITGKFKVFYIKVSPWPLSHTPEISLKLVQNLEEGSLRT
jgi:hypothetical protein